MVMLTKPQSLKQNIEEIGYLILYQNMKWYKWKCTLYILI